MLYCQVWSFLCLITTQPIWVAKHLCYHFRCGELNFEKKNVENEFFLGKRIFSTKMNFFYEIEFFLRKRIVSTKKKLKKTNFFTKRLPFNYDSLFGYFLAYSIQLPCIYCIILSCTGQFSYFVVSFMMLIAVARDITSRSNNLTENYNSAPNDVTFYGEISSLISLHNKSLKLREI